jgi:flagellar basal body-associated protein FliL
MAPMAQPMMAIQSKPKSNNTIIIAVVVVFLLLGLLGGGVAFWMLR